MESKWLAWLKQIGFVGKPSAGITLIGVGALATLTFFWPRLGLMFGAGLAFLGAAIFLLEGPQPYPEEDAPTREEKDWLEGVMSAPTTGMAMVLISGLFLLASMWRWFALPVGLVSIGAGIYGFKLSLREEDQDH